MPLIFASLQLGGNWLQRGWSRAGKKTPIPRRCGGLCPHLKKSFAGALLRRWGLHFSGGSPESIRAGRTSPGQSQELPRPLRALACWRVRCGEGMPPLSAQLEGSPSKRKYEASIREIDCGVRGGGEKVGPAAPLKTTGWCGTDTGIRHLTETPIRMQKLVETGSRRKGP